LSGNYDDKQHKKMTQICISSIRSKTSMALL